MTKLVFNKEKIDRFFSNDYSEDDSVYIDKVFCDENMVDNLRSHLSRQFYGLPTLDENESKDLDDILYRIHFEINSKYSKRKGSMAGQIVKWTFRVASILLLPVVLFIGIKMLDEAKLKKESWVEIKAPAWTRAQFSLPDGTTGWLNSNSSVRYNGNFINDRNIILIGEAYFDVFEDNKRPFKVNTSGISVKVLGTKFNVASYANENNVEVILEEGKLLFSNEVSDKSYTMNPNDLVIYDKTKLDFSTEQVEPQKYLSWTEGKLVFRNDPIDVVARKLERWYNIDVEVSGFSNEDLRLRATFIDENLEEVLNLLKLSLPIDYMIENHEFRPDETYTKKKVIITLKT